MASQFDGRSLRRRVEQEVRDLGGEVRPALYQAVLPAGVNVRAKLVIDAALGPFVCCAARASTALGRLVKVRANGTLYTPEPVHSDVLLDGVNAEGWPRPIVVHGGDNLAIEGADATNTPSNVVFTFGGFHTDQAPGDALRRSGELWAASQVLSTSSAAPHARQTTPFDRDIVALYLAHSASQTDVDGYSVTIAGRKVTPTALKAVPPSTNQLRDPRAWVNLPVRAGAFWQSSLDLASSLTMITSLVGAAKYVG